MSIPKKLNFSDYDNFITEPNFTTSAEAQDYFRNEDELVGALVDSGLWQPETNYANGDVVFSPSVPSGAEAICVVGGISSGVEPSWGSVGGANISDGTCFWKLRWKHWSKDVIPMGNLGIEYATQTEAEAGNDNEKLMTPLRTKEAIDKFAPVKSVNGKTGDVVVGEVTDITIDGTDITVTYADNTTKTLATQDTTYTAGTGLTLNGTEFSLASQSGGSAYKFPYATCSTAANTAAKVATITNGVDFALEVGACVCVKFTVTGGFGSNTKNITLNVNSTGAKTIRYRDAAGASDLEISHSSYLIFIYDGTYWQTVNAELISDYNSD